jgi:hypothetical protein
VSRRIHKRGFAAEQNVRHSHVAIPFPSDALALVALNSLQVDTELRPEQVDRSLSVKANVLHV